MEGKEVEREVRRAKIMEEREGERNGKGKTNTARNTTKEQITNNPDSNEKKNIEERRGKKNKTGRRKRDTGVQRMITRSEDDTYKAGCDKTTRGDMMKEA